MPRIIAHASRSDGPRRGNHWCVVLAAGGSRRLGRPKQFVTLAGTTLVEHACRRALQTRPAGVVVVAGARAERTRALLRHLPVQVVRNPAWRDGLSRSLEAGLGRVPRFAPAVLVSTVDQWCVGARDLRRLLGAGAPAAAHYGGRCGVPALLPRAWRTRLRALRGDRGARDLLAAPGVSAVAMPAAAIDLDTPADLAELRRARTPARACTERRRRAAADGADG